eukprot:CAMPEP_0202712302 /NCGR_PEP_ID=MMETSP1385-20130828/37217_1 /ASSEMBLY_ACC=CAM_ASM_000861 /TAXON_ID=933848 /ORGANISM="Elphidium margaritaceum" /LENGTH=108 /DNA_ID=CAMNT_0049372295 /DNA_START=55 /DNA_END=378 /DNA_ORIENTATION=+
MSSTNSRSRRHQSTDEEAASLLMEEKNNELIEQLNSKVSLLKNGALGLNKVIKADERQRNDIESAMDSASGLLGQAMGKFDAMMQTGGTKTTCYLACFIFVVFLIFYW